MKTFTIKLAVLWQRQWCVHWDLCDKKFLISCTTHLLSTHSMWHKAQHLQLRQCVLVELYMDTDWMDSNGYKLAELYMDSNGCKFTISRCFPSMKALTLTLSLERTELDHRRGGWPLVVVASADLNPAAAGFLYQLMKPLATSATTHVQRPLIWRHTHTAFIGVNNQQRISLPNIFVCVHMSSLLLMVWQNNSWQNRVDKTPSWPK